MIGPFEGQFRFLSNFWASPVTLPGAWCDGEDVAGLWPGMLDGIVVFPTVEHAFQAAKCLNATEFAMVLNARTPAEAKRLGRRVRMRSDWENVRTGVMRLLVQEKFAQNPALAGLLAATGDEPLVEFNQWHDRTWGICTCPRCGGAGENRLGRILMEVRASL